MLDSLVRVSRRVGGATDLLATEMRPATEQLLVIRDHSITRQLLCPEQGAAATEVTTTSPLPVVKS